MPVEVVDQAEPVKVVDVDEPSVEQEETREDKDRMPIYTERTVTTRRKKDFSKYRRQTQ